MKRIYFFTLSILILFTQGCSTLGSLNITYTSYELINNRYDSDSYTNQYGVFFKYPEQQLPRSKTQPLAAPSLSCKVEISNNGQQQTKYVWGRIEAGRAIDNQNTYLAILDFSYLNPNQQDYLKGYIFENKNFHVINNPTCRIIYGGDYEDYNTATMTIPKQDITRPKQTTKSEQK